MWKLISIFHYCDIVTITQYHCIMIGQQKNSRTQYHQNHYLIEKPVITFKNPDACQNYLEIFWKTQMPRYWFFFLQNSRYVSNEQSCLKTTGLYEYLLLLSSLFHFLDFIFSAPISFSLCFQFLPSFFCYFSSLYQA